MGSSFSRIHSHSADLVCNHAYEMLCKKSSQDFVQMHHTSENFPDAPQHYSSMFAKLNGMRITAELTDTEIHYGNTVYPCHSIVLLCRSHFFEKIISQFKPLKFADVNSCKLYEIVIPKEQMKQDVFEDLMTFIYLGQISIAKERLDDTSCNVHLMKVKVKATTNRYLAAAKEWDLQYIQSSEKVTLGQYAHHSSTSFVFRQIFSDEELLSPYITVKENCFEANVMKKLSMFCPLPRTSHEMKEVIPPFDIFICVENGLGLYCHRALLASYSQYFYAMLGTSNFIEHLRDKVMLKDTEVSVIISVIEFIYSTKVCFTEETAYSLTATVNWLCPGSSLSIKAQKYLLQSLSYENCVRNMIFAETHSLDCLHDEAAKLAYRNLSAVARSDSFAKLTFDELCYYLSNSNLSVLNEMEIFFAYDLWARDRHDEDVTYNAFKKVVRLSLLTTAQLRTMAALLSESPRHIKKLLRVPCSTRALRDCMTVLKLSMEAPVEVRASLCQQSFRNSSKQFVLFKNYGWQYSKHLGFHVYQMYFHNRVSDSYPRTHGLNPCCSCKYDWREGFTGSFATAVYDNCIYLSGGYRSKLTNKTFIYHPSRGKCWRNGPPLLIPRFCQSMVAIEESLYVIGGFDKHANLVKTVERLVYPERKWVFETTLLTAAPNTACVGFGGTIYVFAMSCLNRSLYASLHRYCTKKRTWLQPTSLGFNVVKKPIMFSEAVVCNDKIYVFAEEIKYGMFTTVSMFDPVAETWHSDLVELQNSHAAFVHDDLLFTCKFSPNPNLSFNVADLMQSPLLIEPLVLPTFVDKQSLIYNLPMVELVMGVDWPKEIIHKKEQQKGYRPVFFQLHSYYPQSEPAPSLLD